MGIKNLNRFLRENCSKQSISKKHLKYLKNKTVVIDTSIYLYKFAGENSLMESMYLFISILKSYFITPLFVFDGKPPPEKRDLLRQRKIEKKDAEQKYNHLKLILETATDEEKREIIQEMESLKRQIVRVRDEDIKKVKELMDAYGVIYYDAPGEADYLCGYLVKTGKAWGCVSDDMDMFLYGCKNVIRNLSLMNHTVILYDTNSILSDLNMTETQFFEIMVLSGTDYNIHSNTCLRESLKWYEEYKKYFKNCIDEPKYGFYLWLVKNTKYVNDYNHLLKTYKLFQLCNNAEMEKWENLEITGKPENKEELKIIMEREGFVFA